MNTNNNIRENFFNNELRNNKYRYFQNPSNFENNERKIFFSNPFPKRSYSNVTKYGTDQFTLNFENNKYNDRRFFQNSLNNYVNQEFRTNETNHQSKFFEPSKFIYKSHSDTNFQNKIENFKKDPEYIKKLDLSYKKCLDELCNPKDWEDKIADSKFTVNPNTGLPMKSCVFNLPTNDNIEIDEIYHSYVFKRSHFYISFDNPKSFLKKDLINCWRNRGYYVRLCKDENSKWILIISWK